MKNIAIASVVPGLRVRSEMNAHEHWASVHRRKRRKPAAGAPLRVTTQERAKAFGVRIQIEELTA